MVRRAMVIETKTELFESHRPGQHGHTVPNSRCDQSREKKGEGFTNPRPFLASAETGLRVTA